MTDETLTVRVPLALRKRGGRKVVLVPDEVALVAGRAPANWTLVKNVARAYRWKRMLESGDYATIAEVAKAEGVTDSYVSRMLKLALIAPRDVDGIVDGARTARLI